MSSSTRDGTALFLRSDDVADLADPADYVAAVREGYEDRGHGAPAEPRTLLTGGEPPGIMTGYLAVLPRVGAMGGYTYAAGFGGEDAHFVLPLFDVNSGEPIAVLDGAAMNPRKTGAVGAVAVDELASNDASTLALFGSGPQARGQLAATATVRDLADVRVYSPTPDHRESFASTMDDRLEATVRAVESPTAALRDADVVVTATNAGEPVFDGDELPAGAHVTAMGQYHPAKREVDVTTVERSRYVLDLRDRIDQDAGAFMHARKAGVVDEDHVHGELGDVVVGERPGRTASDQVTLFDSGGTAIETVAAGAMLAERARERGRGERIEFAPASEAFQGR